MDNFFVRKLASCKNVIHLRTTIIETNMRIKEEILAQIDDSNIVKAKLIEANDVHPNTVQRWIRNNDEVLTTAKNLAIIGEQLHIEQSQILEEETKAA